MQIGPIWRAMMRNKTGAILIAAQIAFTMTVVLNAYVMVDDYVTRTNRPSGINEMDTFTLRSYAFGNINTQATIEEDLRTIRALPGVINAQHLQQLLLVFSRSNLPHVLRCSLYCLGASQPPRSHHCPQGSGHEHDLVNQNQSLQRFCF